MHMRSVIIECAPMEGVTDYVFRRVQAKHFCPADKYYTPFISPTAAHRFSPKQLREVRAENNVGINLVPQLIGHNAEDFLWACGELKAMGYNEVNFNLGCPSGTVVSKKKGSGLLSERDMLTSFFDEVFEKTPVQVSVKTRIGKMNTEEFSALLELFSCYPISELVIHPRLQAQQYKGTPFLPAWEAALKQYPRPLCYNGDLFTAEKIEAFLENYPAAERVMLGRGLVANPAIAGEIRDGKKPDVQMFREFHAELLSQSRERIIQEKPLLMHMKEFWFYFGSSFENAEKPLKNLKKAQSLADYVSAVNQLFSTCPLRGDVGFHLP